MDFLMHCRQQLSAMLGDESELSGVVLVDASGARVELNVPRGLRPIPNPPPSEKLSSRDRNILVAVAQHGPLKGAALAAAMELEPGGSFKASLADLVRRKLLANDEDGYKLTELGVKAVPVQEPEPVPPTGPAKLTRREMNFLVFIRMKGPVSGERLAEEMSIEYSGSFRDTLADLVKRELLHADRQHGYSLTPDGRIALDALPGGGGK